VIIPSLRKTLSSITFLERPAVEAVVILVALLQDTI